MVLTVAAPVFPTAALRMLAASALMMLENERPVFLASSRIAALNWFALIVTSIIRPFCIVPR